MCKVRLPCYASCWMISREPGDTGLAVGALRLLQRRGGVAVLRQAPESMLALRKVKTATSNFQLRQAMFKVYRVG